MKKQGYSDFFNDLKSVSAEWKTTNKPGIFFAWGTCEFFLDKAIATFKSNKTALLGTPYSRQNGSDLDFDGFSNLWQQAGMFAESEIYIIDHIEKNKNLSAMLEEIPSSNHIGNHILLTYNGSKLPAKIQKDLQKINAKLIHCFEPNKPELFKLTSDLCKKNKLNLGAESIHFLIENLGNELFQLENEIKKISLIFADEPEEHLTVNMISEHLGFLKEDHAFQLTDFLLHSKNSSAQCLIDDLMDRGESPIAVLGILTKHLRNTLIIGYGSKKGLREDVLAKKTKLPNFVVRSYNSYVRKVNLQKIATALTLCQEADLTFKSRKFNEKIVLGEIILAIE